MRGRTLEQLVADENPEVVADAQAMATNILLNMHLAELREKVKKTLAEMAGARGITQPAVAGMEKPGRDLKLSTLKRYVDAAGDKLKRAAERPDGSHDGFRV